MKTKTIKARRMFANYYPHCPVPEIFHSKSRAMSWAKYYSTTVTVPVAVIPLDDMEALVEKAKTAFNLEGSGLFTPAMRAALAAIGVLPKQRKGRK